MLKNEIEVGETYLFVGSDSPARKHLAGEPFTVTEKKRVFRKGSYKRGKRTMKVLRFFNEDGIGARAEELEPLPGDMFHKCGNCKTITKVEELHTEEGSPHSVCPECGETAQIHDLAAFNQEIEDTRNEWKEAAELPEKDGIYNVVTTDNQLMISGYEAGKWDYDEQERELWGDAGGKVMRWRPSTWEPFEQNVYCAGCLKKPEELAEYVEAAEDEETTPAAYVISEEGTYNPATNTFLCTNCYIEYGQPTAPDGWKAPALMDPTKKVCVIVDISVKQPDDRESPCPECEWGEMTHQSSQPNGQQYFKCDGCGFSASFP